MERGGCQEFSGQSVSKSNVLDGWFGEGPCKPQQYRSRNDDLNVFVLLFFLEPWTEFSGTCVVRTRRRPEQSAIQVCLGLVGCTSLRL